MLSYYYNKSPMEAILDTVYLFLIIIMCLFIMSSTSYAEEVCLPLESRGVYIEVPYVVNFNVKSDCSIKAKNDLTKIVRDTQKELDRCNGVIVETPTAPPTIEPTPTAPPTPLPNEDFPIPSLAKWEENMITYGLHHATDWGTGQECYQDQNEACLWYYDGARVLYQIADYTGDDSWKVPALKVSEFYRDMLLAANPVAHIPVWRIFAHGIARSYQETGDQSFLTAFEGLENSSMVSWMGGAGDFVYPRAYSWGMHITLQSEFVLNRGTHLNRESVKNILVGYLTTWVNGEAPFVKPFFLALVWEALIDYYENYPTSDVRTILLDSIEWLYLHSGTFNPDVNAFAYAIGDVADADENPAVDLNLLIAPAYAWAYKETGDHKFRIWGDAIFSAGVENSWLGNLTDAGPRRTGGKHFSQNYRWSFKFVEWRR